MDYLKYEIKTNSPTSAEHSAIFWKLFLANKYFFKLSLTALSCLFHVTAGDEVLTRTSM